MIPRLFCGGRISTGATFTLPDNAAHHVRDVLRLQTGDAVTLLNGLGGEYQALIAVSTKKAVSVEVRGFARRESEPPWPITVAQSLAAGDKMDWIVEKAVELGASSVQPLAASRSVLRLSPERAEKRLAHWRAIAVAACEQCGRNRIPHIAPIQTVHAWLAGMRGSAGLHLMLSPVHAEKFSSLSGPAAGTSITLLIGPEAGLTDDEEAAAQHAGFRPILLGPRVMRTETAALAALAAIHSRWGDY